MFDDDFETEIDPDRFELAALGGAADRLRMNAEPLGELARLVVLLDHRRRVELGGKTVTITKQLS